MWSRSTLRAATPTTWRGGRLSGTTGWLAPPTTTKSRTSWRQTSGRWWRSHPAIAPSARNGAAGLVYEDGEPLRIWFSELLGRLDDPVLISDRNVVAYAPDIAQSNNRFVVAWTQGAEVPAVTLDWMSREGGRQGDAAQIIGAGELPALAGFPTWAAVGWIGPDNRGLPSILISRRSAD